MNRLVERARRGEAGAFDRLYRENVGRVYALCLRMTADPERAERLTQDAFVRAWQGLDTFRGESRFSTWLHRLTVNVVLDDRRATARRWNRRAEGPDLESVAAVARSGAPETRVDLERAIAALPPGARAMVVLHDVEGYPYEEVATLTGVAVGTVKSQLHRARRLLREALA